MTLLTLLTVLSIYCLLMFATSRIPAIDGNTGWVVRGAITIFFVIYLLKATGLIGALNVSV